MRRERLQFIVRIEVLEKERRDPRGEENHEENNEGEGEANERHRDEEDPEQRRFIRLIKVVQGTSAKTQVDIPIYQGKMESEEVLGLIEAVENYFDLEDVDGSKKVKIEKERLRGTTLTWWTSI